MSLFFPNCLTHGFNQIKPGEQPEYDWDEVRAVVGRSDQAAGHRNPLRREPQQIPPNAIGSLDRLGVPGESLSEFARSCQQPFAEPWRIVSQKRFDERQALAENRNVVELLFIAQAAKAARQNFVHVVISRLRRAHRGRGPRASSRWVGGGLASFLAYSGSNGLLWAKASPHAAAHRRQIAPVPPRTADWRECAVIEDARRDHDEGEKRSCRPARQD